MESEELKEVNAKWTGSLSTSSDDEKEPIGYNFEKSVCDHVASTSSCSDSLSIDSDNTSSDSTNIFNGSRPIDSTRPRDSANTLSDSGPRDSANTLSDSGPRDSVNTSSYCWRDLLCISSDSVSISSDSVNTSSDTDYATSDEEDNSSYCKGRTRRNRFIKCKFRNFRIRQSWTCSKSVVPYFMELISAYEYNYLTYVYEHLEGSRLVVLINKELARFFNDKLKNKKSKDVIRALHAIHSLIINPLSMPKTIAKVLAHDHFFSPLFDVRCHYNYCSFCFLTKEILTDILSELFRKADSKEWLGTFLRVLNVYHGQFCKDGGKTKTFSFGAIAAYLAIGIEVLPRKYYPSQDYFNRILDTVSRHKLSRHCLEKVWDELLLFYDHWVKYALIYPFSNCLDPSHSPTKFKKCKLPDLSIFNNTYMRNRMKYEYVHVEDGYVPCEFPLVPSFPRLPQTYPTLKDMQKSHIFWSFSKRRKIITEDIIGPGYCVECKKSDCSCLEDYIESEARKKRQLLCNASMEVEEGVKNASSSKQNEGVKNASSSKQNEGVKNASSSKQNEGVKNASSSKQNEGVKNASSSKQNKGVQNASSSKQNKGVKNASSSKQNKSSSISESRLSFASSDALNKDLTSKEMSDYYDSLIKRNTRSYPISVSQSKKIGKKIKMPDFKNAIPCTTLKENERSSDDESQVLNRQQLSPDSIVVVNGISVIEIF